MLLYLQNLSLTAAYFSCSSYSFTIRYCVDRYKKQLGHVALQIVRTLVK